MILFFNGFFEKDHVLTKLREDITILLFTDLFQDFICFSLFYFIYYKGLSIVPIKQNSIFHYILLSPPLFSNAFFLWSFSFVVVISHLSAKKNNANIYQK